MPAKAPELRVPFWIDANGNERDALKLADLGTGYKVIFAFKSTCPSCHSFGFPAMKAIYEGLKDKDVGLAVIHTAFDDDPRNTREKVAALQAEFEIPVPFGHDPKVGDAYPTFMTDYQTRGTPYFIVLDAKNEIIFSDFRLDPDKVIAVLGKS